MKKIFILIFLFISCSNNYEEIDHYENGDIKSIISYNSDKLKNGKAEYYYLSGKLQESISYKNDERNGNYSSFYKSGNVFSELFYLDDVRNGKAIEYFEDGKKKVEVFYKNGIPNGSGYIYRDNGSLKAYLFYSHEDGALVYRRSYNENGEISEKTKNLFGSIEINKVKLNLNEEVFIEVFPVIPPDTHSILNYELIKSKNRLKKAKVSILESKNKYEIKERFHEKGEYTYKIELNVVDDKTNIIQKDEFIIDVQIK